MVSLKRKAEAKRSWVAWIKYKVIKFFDQKNRPYLNRHMIDDYIDQFWIFNCPNNYSVGHINNQVHKLFHQLLTENDKEIK